MYADKISYKNKQLIESNRNYCCWL